MGRRILALPVGAKYGRLTVVENLGTDHTKHNRVMVECDCGSARKTVYASRIKSGATRSCGCLNVESGKKTCHINRTKASTETPFKRLMKMYKSNASQRSIEFELDRDQFMAILVSPCHFCGRLPIEQTESGTASGVDFVGRRLYGGVDRFVNAIGYTKENCVPCCKACNRSKLDLSSESFLRHALSIAYLQSMGLRIRDADLLLSSMFSSYKDRAKQKGLDFSLSDVEFRLLASANCHYCGTEPLRRVHRVKRQAKNGGRTIYASLNGIDRVDNGAGYVYGNCVPCCERCNSSKAQNDVKVWIDHMIRVAGFFGKERRQ